jgi:hypothetical protein
MRNASGSIYMSRGYYPTHSNQEISHISPAASMHVFQNFSKAEVINRWAMRRFNTIRKTDIV